MTDSSIFLKRTARSIWVVVAAMLYASSGVPVGAVDPNRNVEQYIHDRWESDRGFPGGSVHGITQSADGYLWIAADKGLVRFDGLAFELIGRPAAQQQDPALLSVMDDPTDGVWMQLRSAVLMRYRHGRFDQPLPAVLDDAEAAVTAMTRTSAGEILLAVLNRGLIRHRNGHAEKLISSSAMPSSFVIAIAETGDGDVWLGTRDSGLLRLHGGQLTPIVQGLPDQKINALVAGEGNTLWIGTDGGVSRWNGVAVTSVGVPASLAHVDALAMIRDRDGNVWIGTASGELLRVNGNGVASVDAKNRLGRGAVTAIFEDRDRNLWIGTNRGVERVRDGVFTTYSTAQGLPPGASGAIDVDMDRVWVAPVAGGLYAILNRQVTLVRAGGLADDVIYSISGDGDDVWFARQRGGLTRLHRTASGFEARTFTRADGLSQDSVYAVHKARDGAVWAGTLSAGLNRFADGRFTTFTMGDGLPSNTISAIAESADGSIWVATPNGASHQQPNGWNRIGTAEGLPSNNVNTLFEDSKRDMWIGTASGLALARDGRIRGEFRAPDRLRSPILGIGEDRRGALWIATSDHIVSVNRDRLAANAAADVDVRVYDGADGLLGVEGVRRYRSVAADSAGRVWVSTPRGLSMADPDATGRAARALVAVESVSADGAVVPGPPFLLPVATKRVAFTFTGLSLGTPERVLFRYRLDQFDPDWSAPSPLRQATYTNLGPGDYHFRVIASNGDGAWDGEARLVAISIAPAFWQTTAFRIAVLVMVSAIAWGVYRLRLLQVQRQLGVRFEERLAERTRIAQELHDTLLQGFLSASMQLHAAVKRLPGDSPVVPTLTKVLDLMQRVIVEGRNAVRGLRSAVPASDDLQRAFSSMSDELNALGAVDYRVVIEGHDRPLQPFVRDEIYRIGREAVSNAFRHASASEVELALEYETRGLRLRVRDNGRGIESHVLQAGTDGHWGLAGMRERAEHMGADFRVWSNGGAGTEIELFIPAKIAFRPEKQHA